MLGSLSTVGATAGMFQKSPKEIQAALRTLDLRPALTLNCLHYFRDEDIDAAIKFINLGCPDTDRREEVPVDVE